MFIVFLSILHVQYVTNLHAFVKSALFYILCESILIST